MLIVVGLLFSPCIEPKVYTLKDLESHKSNKTCHWENYQGVGGHL